MTDRLHLQVRLGMLLAVLPLLSPAAHAEEKKVSGSSAQSLVLLNGLQLPQCVTDVTTYYSPASRALNLYLQHPAGIQLTVKDSIEGGSATIVPEAAATGANAAQNQGGPYFLQKIETSQKTLLEIHLVSGGKHQLIIAPIAGQIAPLELSVWVGSTVPCLASATSSKTEEQRVPFKDVAADYRWAEASIGLLSAEGVLSPVAADEFGPGKEVSRGEFAEALTIFFGLRRPRAPMPIADVGANSNAYDAIEAIVPYLGYSETSGTPQTFAPQGKINHQQAIVTVAKILAASGLTKVPDSAQTETILTKRSAIAATQAENRSYLALGMKVGFVRDWPASSQMLNESLTRAELAALLLNIEFVFHFSDVRCPKASASSSNPAVGRIHLPASITARPSWSEVCGVRLALSRGAVITSDGSPSGISALLGRRFPFVTVSVPQPATEATRKKAQKAVHRFHKHFSSTPPTPVISGVYLEARGVPNMYEGFVQDQALAYRLSTTGLQRWLGQASKAASNLEHPTHANTSAEFRTTSGESQGEPGVCGVALGGPNVGPGTAANTWYCYIELLADYFDSNWGDYLFMVDLLRQDENDPENDRYAFAAQWDSRPQASDNFQCDDSGGWIFIGSKTCTAFVYSRSISMQNQTSDTNPALGGWSGVPLVSPPSPSNLPMVPMRLPDASLFHGPTTSAGSVSQSVGGGLSAGVSYGANGLSVSANISESFTVGTSHSDVAITDNTVTLHGQPTSNFPANTADWLELFTPGAGVGYASWTAPALDARSGFDGLNEIAVYEVGDQFQTEPFQASVFGTVTGGSASITYALGLPIGGFIEGIPLVDMQVTFALSPPTFSACSGSEIIDILTLGFANEPIVCSVPGAGTQELDVPTGTGGTPGTLLMFGKEAEYGAPVAWLAVNQQAGAFGTNSQPDLFPGLTPANCLIPGILCAMQVSLVNPSAAAGTQGFVAAATNPAFVVDNGVLPYKAVAMAITSITPNSGTAAGGTSVTIQGVGFFNLDSIQFGSATISSCATSSQPCFSVNSQGTQINLVTPSGPAGNVPITLSNVYLATTSPAQFTYTNPPFQVTAVSASVSPPSYTGTCPETFTFTANITANAAGIVTYTWLRSDGAQAPTQTITFSGPGTQTVSTTWTLSPASYSGSEQLKILSPNSMVSNSATFTLGCT
jgi:hypothetical protein